MMVSNDPTYRRKRADVPPYRAFGAATHVDSAGREYRPHDNDNQTLLCRIRRRRRSRPNGTPIGGSSQPPAAPPSLAGGQWEPRWPQPGDEIVLFRIKDQQAESVVVRAVWSMPRGSTARIELDPPGVQSPLPFKDGVGKALGSSSTRMVAEPRAFFAALSTPSPWELPTPSPEFVSTPPRNLSESF